MNTKIIVCVLAINQKTRRNQNIEVFKVEGTLTYFTEISAEFWNTNTSCTSRVVKAGTSVEARIDCTAVYT